MNDVIAMGELLIDFTPAGISKNGSAQFERNPGGAPANVLVTLAKLGKKTAFIGKVGNDQFGHFLKDVLIDNKVNVEGLVLSEEVNTTLAFVHLSDGGDRSFSFYRKPGADLMITVDDIDFRQIENSRLFHFGSLSLTDEPAATATLKAVKHAKSSNLLISYDPNLRMPLWSSEEHARKMIFMGMQYADIVKISEEELEFLTGVKDLVEGTKMLQDRFQTSLILVTLGAEGCFYRMKRHYGGKNGFTVKTIDTTGAGDAFMGAAIYKILESNKPFEQLTIEELEEMVLFANACGALATTKNGAIPSIPNLEEIRKFLL